MAAETLYVDPPFLRRAAGNVSDLGETIAGDFAAVSKSVRADTQHGSLPPWQVSRVVGTADKLWSTYLSRLGGSVAVDGDWLRQAADAYQRRDEEAAEALGLALPADGPVVKARPGSVPE